MENPTIFQSFHWYYPSDGRLWNHVAAEAAKLKELGVTHVWLPPAYKAADGPEGVGYAVYDLFDLGEFNQKGSVRTKYGTKQEYISCINALHYHQLQVLADVVLNHKQGADEKQLVPVIKVNPNNRKEYVGEKEVVDLYTRYYFPGRGKKYSEFEWDFQTFTGIDRQQDGDYQIYKILNQYGSDWDDVIEDELGNFDYLMGADIELRNPYVREELKKWGKWFCALTKVDGFRLDAVKHMSTNFVKEWLDYIRGEFNRDFFTIAEYWSGKPEVLQKYVDALEGRTHLMDVPLHNNFHEAGKSDAYDLRNLLKGTLLERRPERTITFVDNHDTQPLQTLESTVSDSFKSFAYAISLLRLEGIPCVFYPDLFGAEYHDGEKQSELKKVKKLKKMMKARRLLAYGEQRDEFNHKRLIGWTRSGIVGKEYSGLAVLLNRSKEPRNLEMKLGALHSRKKFVDLTGRSNEIIETNKDGIADFPVHEESVSVWIREEAQQLF